jgi:hypothetical protein
MVQVNLKLEQAPLLASDNENKIWETAKLNRTRIKCAALTRFEALIKQKKFTSRQDIKYNILILHNITIAATK